MNHRNWHRVYRVPENPLARAGLVVVMLAVIAVSFFVGLMMIAVFAGLAVLGAIYLAIQRLIQRFRKPRRDTENDDDIVQVEYKVVRREKDRQ